MTHKGKGAIIREAGGRRSQGAMQKTVARNGTQRQGEMGRGPAGQNPRGEGRKVGRASVQKGRKNEKNSHGKSVHSQNSPGPIERPFTLKMPKLTAQQGDVNVQR